MRCREAMTPLQVSRQVTGTVTSAGMSASVKVCLNKRFGNENHVYEKCLSIKHFGIWYEMELFSDSVVFEK